MGIVPCTLLHLRRTVESLFPVLGFLAARDKSERKRCFLTWGRSTAYAHEAAGLGELAPRVDCEHAGGRVR